MLRPALLALAAGALLLAGCGSSPARQGAPPAATGGGTAPSTPGAPAAKVTKVLVIMEENHDAGVVLPRGMPYLESLATRYGVATDWSDVGHPSLPNYLAIFGGSSFGAPQDCSPGPGCDYPGPSVFGQAIAAGRTARSYEQSMPAPCSGGYTGNYDVNHNPWVYFPSEARLCRADDVPAGTPSAGALVSDIRSGSLPTVGLLTPDLISDAHDGTLADADRFLREWIPVLTSGPDWRSGHLAVVVTFDEGESGEIVPTVVIDPALHHVVVGARLDHYALARLLDQVAGVPALRYAAGAADLAGLFGLTT